MPKHARRLGHIEDMVLSLYSRGMTTRDIEAHLREVYGVSASRELIPNVTDVVTDEIELWRNRPVDEVYPVFSGGLPAVVEADSSRLCSSAADR